MAQTPEARNKVRLAWYYAHHAQARAANTKWCKEHPEQRLEHKRWYAKKHSVDLTAKAMQWAREHPEARKRIQVDWRWRRRLAIIEAYGGACAQCGETIPEFLTVDHIDDMGAEHRRHVSGSVFYTWLKKRGYPKDNYQLLCMNCNFAKGHKQGTKLNWRQKIRREVVKEYGGRCACCGEATSTFLAIDHKDGSGAEHRRQLGRGKTFGGGEFYRWLKTQGYPKDNYQLLCMNCNLAKGHFGVCPHQKGLG